MKSVLALDQGTTSSRAILFGEDGTLRGVAQKGLQLSHPKSGWVEQNPREIIEGQLAAACEVAGTTDDTIHALGITNQRETTILWDRRTGEAVYPAIVWQDRRTADACAKLRADGIEKIVRDRTGLLLDPYFSATKLSWILQSDPEIRRRAIAGELCFGTVDSYLVWHLTSGNLHITDLSNASRTMLCDISTMTWEEELLEIFDIPIPLLPRIVGSSEVYGEVTIEGPLKGVPIAGLCGDQQSALFGQQCVTPGMAKNTYGTGCFVVMNTGPEQKRSSHGLITTVAWKIGDEVTYALEGSVFVAGAAVQWLRDGLGIIAASGDVEALARSVESSDGVFVVPAFTGLGAPYWDAEAKGGILGLTRGSTAAHIARATLEGIAYQVCDVVAAMKEDSGIPLTELRVDGGASPNNFLMQLQSDLLQSVLLRPRCVETTALGAAYLAGLGSGLWNDTSELKSLWQIDRRFEPHISSEEAEERHRHWREAVKRVRSKS